MGIDDLFEAEGGKVVARLVVSGTHTGGPFAGIPPAGKQASWVSIRIYQIANGQIVEMWAMQDRLGLLEQLGAVERVQGVTWVGGRSSERESES